MLKLDACNHVHLFGKKVFPLSVLDRLVFVMIAHEVDKCLSIASDCKDGSNRVISD